MAKSNSIASSPHQFDPNNDERFSYKSAHMNLCRINGLADATEDYIEDMLFGPLDSEVYLQLHAVLAMARMCKNLSGELLEYSDNIVVTAPKENNNV